MDNANNAMSSQLPSRESSLSYPRRSYSPPRTTQQQPAAHIPVLFSLIENKQWSEAIQRLKQHPDEAGRKIFLPYSASTYDHDDEDEQTGFTALHLACQHQPPVEFVNTLVHVHEPAVQAKGPEGSLPLHVACSAGASSDVVARLLITYPSATRCKDAQGQLPLHVAVRFGAHEDVLMALIVVHPKASVIRNTQGQTPVEMASSSSVAKRALKRAPLLIAVSKAAMDKMTYESDAKLREVVEVYQDRMTQVKEKYEEDKAHAVSLESQLRQELWREKERTGQLEEQAQSLDQALKDKQQELEQQQQLLEHIQGLISHHSRRDERRAGEGPALGPTINSSTSGAVPPAPATRHPSRLVSPRPSSGDHPPEASRSKPPSPKNPPKMSSSPSSAAAVAASPAFFASKDTDRRRHIPAAPSPATIARKPPTNKTETRQQEEHRGDQQRILLRHDEETRLKIAVKEWMSPSSNPLDEQHELPHAHSNESSTAIRQSIDDEERDPPPVPTYHDFYASGEVAEPSPKSAAVATVKEWLGTTLTDKPDDGRFLGGSSSIPTSLKQQAQHQVVYSQSLLDRSKRSSGGLAGRAAAEYKNRLHSMSTRGEKMVRGAHPPTHSSASRTPNNSTPTTNHPYSTILSRTGVLTTNKKERPPPASRSNQHHSSPAPILRIQAGAVNITSSPANSPHARGREEPVTPFSGIVGQFDRHMDPAPYYLHDDDDDDEEPEEDYTIDSKVEWE